MKKFKQYLMYFGGNGAIMVLAYFGFVVGIPWCANLAGFGIIVLSILCMLISLILGLVEGTIKNEYMSYEVAQKSKDDRRSFIVPMWFDVLYDSVLLVGLVVLGHHIIGVFALITMLCTIYTRLAVGRINDGVDLIIQRENGDVDDNRLDRLGVFNFTDDGDDWGSDDIIYGQGNGWDTEDDEWERE